MEIQDDDLREFEANGATPLPVTNDQGSVENEGARIWYASYGSGAPVILLHGGLGNSGNWGYQVPVLVKTGYQVSSHPRQINSKIFSEASALCKPHSPIIPHRTWQRSAFR